MPQSSQASCEGASVHGISRSSSRGTSRKASERCAGWRRSIEARLDALRDDPDEPVDIVHDATLTNNK